MTRTKKLSYKSLLGQRGANLIERILTDMGQVWRPTVVHDTGVDGTMELRDAYTGEVFNSHIQVQSKATGSRWESETTQGFIYRVREEDLNYWLRGNLPVILVVSRPDTDEAYWVSINRYFHDPKTKASKKVEFHKERDRFDKDSLDKIRDLAIPTEKGIYKPPLRKQEELVSNLLEVSAFPRTTFVAATQFRKRKELNDWMTEHGIHGKREWILKNERIFSFHDLHEYPWTEVSDYQTVHAFESREWADSDDEPKILDWVELLNTCIRGKLSREGIRYQHESQFRFFYFLPGRNGKPRFYRYHSQQKETQREVVAPFVNKKTKVLMCYRHSAMVGRFRRLDSRWYLEITPTYFYTCDGEKPYPFHEDQLAGIKRLERNEAVLGQLIMWERLLTDRGDIFRHEYRFLRFNGLLRFTVDQGIPDDLWLPVVDAVVAEDDDMDLFGSIL